ncbi:MAG: hypothetical protein ACYC0V_11470 [Armatimonadota bacterium]
MNLIIGSILLIVAALIGLAFTIRDWNSNLICDHKKRRWLALIPISVLLITGILMLITREELVLAISTVPYLIALLIMKDASEKAHQKASDMSGKIILFDQTQAKDSKKDEGDCSE